ncbi:hypothetical protein LAZ67_13000404 [Cordylochernes scorpioides]|uniref:Uncharacterized protein n=1 Tax=Cordylochernes scorpioides TaxID=51811 RepID=A0ABY6L5D9_9ARAC|nr:hypothetical protein LAZ67_13000404 [Cordylochernes scorpioides]
MKHDAFFFFFFFYPQTKIQSLEWHTPSSPRKKKVRLDKSKGKNLPLELHERFVPLKVFKAVKDP